MKTIAATKQRKHPLPDPIELRKRFHYDPVTGKIYRKWKSGWKEVFRGHNGEYLDGRIDYVMHRAHRVAWALHTGVWPEGDIDHIDGDGTNNRWVNMREVTAEENSHNMKKFSTNSSGVTGVSKYKGRNKWAASIYVGGRDINLGSYASKKDAVAARKAAEAEYGFHSNHGRA